MPILRSQINATVTGGDTLFIPCNSRRVGLIIGAPLHATVWLSFTGPAAVGVGLPLHPGQTALVLDLGKYGEAITEEIRAVSDGVAEVMGALELSH